MTDASQLLSLLRGHSSPSAPSSAAPSSYPVSPPPTAPITAPSDLDRLFRTAFSTSHPSSSPSAEASIGEGVRHPDVNANGKGNANGLGGIIEHSPEPLATKQSASLLSLLQQISAAPPPIASPSISTPPPSLPTQTQAQATSPRPAAGSDASALLAQLMGTSLPPPAPSPLLSSDSASQATARPTTPYTSEGLAALRAQMTGSTHGSSPLGPRSDAESGSAKGGKGKGKKGLVKATSSSPAPAQAVSAPVAPPAPTQSPFTFISPFDLLAQGAALSPPSAPSSLPPHIAAPPPISTASSDDERFTLPPVLPPVPASTTSDERALLAYAYLPPTPLDALSYAPTGLRLPASSETLRIDVRAENVESLDVGPRVAVVPITLFSIPLEWAPGAKAGVWARGICYATKAGKIRVIDRVSGARLLLKGHVGGVEDLAVARGSEGERRTLASAGREGKLIVWSVSDAFEADGQYERTLEIQGKTAGTGPRFQRVKLHPRFPEVQVVAVAINDGRLAVLDLASPALAAAGGIGGEGLFEESGKVMEAGSAIVDFAFSPDGSAIALLTSDGTYSLRRTDDLNEIIQTDTVAEMIGELSSIVFLADPSARPTALAISSHHGTFLRIVPLHRTSNGDSTLEFVLPGSPDDSTHFGHMAYHSPTSTLFVSNSLRGSLFTFQIAFDPLDALQSNEADDDAAFFAIRPVQGTTRPPRIEHVLEIPTPDPIIGFSLDDSKDDDTLSALVVHPAGIHQITFNHSRQVAAKEPENGRRMSLESSIFVESEVEVKVDEADTNPLVVPSPSVQRRPSISAIEEDLVAEERAERGEVPTEDLGEVHEESVVETKSVVELASPKIVTPVKLAGPVVNAAVKSMKEKKGKAAAQERAIKVESPSASAEAERIANMWATGGAGAGAGKKGAKAEANAEVLKEIKKLEESLPAKVGKLFASEMDKQAQRVEDDRAVAQAADLARQENMLKLVSTTLAKSTSKLVETTLKEQIKSQVIPSLGKLVSAAVSEQISLGVSDAISKTLPNELERLLYRPDLTAHLARNFSSAVGPALERNLHAVVSASVESVMKGVRQEMVAVRKEIVREQSDALEFTEQEVHALRNDVVELRAALERMESIVLSLKTPAPTPALPNPPHQQQRQSSQPIPASQYALPPIPRTETPPARYEELFTNALQPDNEPEFTSLLYLIKSSPPSRLEAVFPPPPGRPRISSPVILSLAYRLAQVLSTKEGPLDEEGRKQLHWVRKCLTSMDGKDQETAGYTPRILESVISCLSIPAKRLKAQNSQRAAEEFRTVEHFARARLALFSEGVGNQQGFRR